MLAKFFGLLECQNTFVRAGGKIHAISIETSVSESSDQRLDYVAIGDVKHSDPLYATYSISHVDVKVNCSLDFIPMDNVVEETINNTFIPDAQVSKEVFKNLASFRIGAQASNVS